ncbi:MAG: N-acetylglucosamine-6-phosphate deacetylase [Rhodoglobus sp.]
MICPIPTHTIEGIVTTVIIHSVTLVSDGHQVRDAWVRFTGATVTERGTGDDWRTLLLPGVSVVDGSGHVLTPGFVDIHVHGGGGSAFLDSPHDTDIALATHRAHGTTRSAISLVSASVPELDHQLTVVRALMHRDPLVLGAHLEGPFLSSDFRGAHDNTALIAPDASSVARMIDTAEGCLRQITLAPELPGGMAAISACVDAGVRVAVGHTGADYRQAREAFDSGASLLTHAFNGMRGIHHRAPGPVVAAIESDHVTLELVADGTHVHAPSARLLALAVPGRLCLVTDAMAAAGGADGDYELGSLAVRVRDGVARLVEGDSIAGSTLTMNRALKFAVTELGMALPDAVAAATSVPARALGLPSTIGSLAVGSTADAVLLDSDFAVRGVWADGSELIR